jgi:hypothetical protein
MPQFTTRAMLIAVAVLSAFFAGWLFGSIYRSWGDSGM